MGGPVVGQKESRVRDRKTVMFGQKESRVRDIVLDANDDG